MKSVVLTRYIFTCVLLVMLCGVWAHPASALNPFEVALGVGLGAGFHELGHHVAIVNAHEEENVVWDPVHLRFELVREVTPSAGRRIAVAGIVADVLADQVLQHYHSDTVLGWRGWVIVGGAVTAIRGWSSSDHGGRDYGLYDKYGGDHRALAAARLGYSLLQGYRMWRDPGWTPWVSGDKVGVTLRW